jgi:hypothetical protein
MENPKLERLQSSVDDLTLLLAIYFKSRSEPLAAADTLVFKAAAKRLGITTV